VNLIQKTARIVCNTVAFESLPTAQTIGGRKLVGAKLPMETRCEDLQVKRIASSFVLCVREKVAIVARMPAMAF
jgi:hypothetical protein